MENLPTTHPTKHIAQADKVLIANQLRLSKIRNVAKVFEGIEIDAKTDAKAKEFIDGVRKAVKDFKDKRSPITREMDRIKKLFTEVEDEAMQCANLVKGKRDEFAAKEYEKIKKKQNQIDESLAIKENLREQFANLFTSKLISLESRASAMLAEITPDNLEDSIELINSIPETIPSKNIDDFFANYSFSTRYGSDVKTIAKEAKEQIADKYQQRFSERMNEIKTSIISAFKGKEYDAPEVIAEVMSNESIDSKEELINDAIDAAAEKIEIEEQKVNKKVEMTIEVTDVMAYKQIVGFWFEYCLESYRGNDVGKKTMASMLRDVEKYCNKHGRYIESKGLEYIEKVTAK